VAEVRVSRSSSHLPSELSCTLSTIYVLVIQYGYKSALSQQCLHGVPKLCQRKRIARIENADSDVAEMKRPWFIDVHSEIYLDIASIHMCGGHKSLLWGVCGN
jgi:hypothetical protein